LSAGKDKHENFERLLREGKLGRMAAVGNLRLMLAVGVEPAAHSRTPRKKGGAGRSGL